MSIAPLIGSFQAPPFAELAERLDRAAALFMEGRVFSGYITTQSLGNFYGLSTADAVALVIQHGEEVKTANLSVNVSREKSINISIRFGPPGSPARGQYVIAVEDEFDQADIRAVIQGVYREPTEEEEAFRRNTRQSKAQQAVAATPVYEEDQPRRPENLDGALRESFLFAQEISGDHLLATLQQIRKTYFASSQIAYRLVERSGNTESHLSASELSAAITNERNQILRLLVEISNPGGEIMDLTLHFNPSQKGPNADVLILSPKARQVFSTLRTQLQEQNIVAPEVSRQAFRFLPSQLNVDALSQLMGAASIKFFNGKAFEGEWQGLDGKQQTGLSPAQLRQHFLNVRPYTTRIKVINGNLYGSFLSLEFHFQGKNQGLGVLECRRLPAQAQKVMMEALSKQLKVSPAHLRETPEMVIFPAFEGRGLTPRRGNCLAVIPLEAYWAGVVAERIESALAQMGLHAEGAPSMYDAGQRENIWTAINEAEIIILDLTYKHTDVLFAAGIAQTLGRPLLLLSQHDRDIPPDWKRFPWIIYQSHESGLDQLESELGEALRALRK